MRLWSINPGYLDSMGKTAGYKNHPQLVRFKSTSNSVGAIASYLRAVAEEANSRGYYFDKSKIQIKRLNRNILVTNGQAEYEFQHLLNKLKSRDTGLYKSIRGTESIRLHPLFSKTRGSVEPWEVV